MGDEREREDGVTDTQRPHCAAASSHSPLVALLGNPNTGKTTLFNALAGMRQHVGNYPGVTVETKKGRMTARGQSVELIDLPGTYSLAPRSPDEMVAVDVLLGRQPGECQPDMILAIVDASNLERNLYLVSQALEIGPPLVIALNMTDVAERHGLRIDAGRLGKQLGVPVVPIQANKGKGLGRLKEAIAEALWLLQSSAEPRKVDHIRQTDHCPRALAFPEAFEGEASQLRDHIGRDLPPFLVRRLLLDVGGYTERRLADLHHDLPHDVASARARLAAAGCPVPAVEARTRYSWIRQATSGTVERPAQRPVTWTDRLDRLLTHRVWGTLVFLALMFVVFQAIFTWSRPLMKLIGDGKDAFNGLLRGALPAGPLTSLLTDGVMEGVGSVVIFLPQILILFGFIAVLEDCGYMARAAFLMDRLMARCGLSGKSFIPMLSSVACAVPGIMATRVIENRRDRLATILVAPLMSCSARLPVYTLLIGAFLTVGYPMWLPGLTMFCLYALGLVIAPLVALALKRTLLRGETPVFVLEMPTYKWPSGPTILRRVQDSAWAFLRRAGTLILASMIVVWALLYFPRLEVDGRPCDEVLSEQTIHIAELQAQGETAEGEHKEQIEAQLKAEQERAAELDGGWKRQSLLGRAGHWLEPAVRPLGWDWRVGMAALASFPAREVVVGTLGIIYNQGRVESEEVRAGGEAATSLGQALREAAWDDEPSRKVFRVPTALSLMVFFALCCQCASTLAVIRRETNSWRWPAFTFAYMTLLAYVGALVVYQAGVWIMP